MARVAIEFLRENFQREQNARQRRCEEFSRELRILNVGRAALRAAQRRTDFRIGFFPFDHQTLRLFKIFFVNFHFHVCLRFGHESDPLQVTFSNDVGADTDLP